MPFYGSYSLFTRHAGYYVLSFSFFIFAYTVSLDASPLLVLGRAAWWALKHSEMRGTTGSRLVKRSLSAAPTTVSDHPDGPPSTALPFAPLQME